jgi:hypothetical protein
MLFASGPLASFQAIYDWTVKCRKIPAIEFILVKDWRAYSHQRPIDSWAPLWESLGN